jgi:hypothetical protein
MYGHYRAIFWQMRTTSGMTCQPVKLVLVGHELTNPLLYKRVCSIFSKLGRLFKLFFFNYGESQIASRSSIFSITRNLDNFMGDLKTQVNHGN